MGTNALSFMRATIQFGLLVCFVALAATFLTSFTDGRYLLVDIEEKGNGRQMRPWPHINNMGNWGRGTGGLGTSGWEFSNRQDLLVACLEEDAFSTVIVLAPKYVNIALKDLSTVRQWLHEEKGAILKIITQILMDILDDVPIEMNVLQTMIVLVLKSASIDLEEKNAIIFKAITLYSFKTLLKLKIFNQH